MHEHQSDLAAILSLLTHETQSDLAAILSLRTRVISRILFTTLSSTSSTLLVLSALVGRFTIMPAFQHGSLLTSPTCSLVRGGVSQPRLYSSIVSLTYLQFGSGGRITTVTVFQHC